jgi:two-component system response regulator HydG
LPENLLRFHRKKELTRDTSSEKSAKDTPSPKSLISIAHLERQAILEAVRQMNGDKRKAAQLLGIGKTTLYRKLKAYNATEATNSLEPTFSSVKCIA